MTGKDASGRDRGIRPPPRELLYSETLPIDEVAAELDLAELRRRFAPMFDRAARAVQLAGYEQDDTVVARVLVCRAGEQGRVEVPAEFLADRARLLGVVTRAVTASVGRPVAASAVQLIGLKVSAYRERWT